MSDPAEPNPKARHVIPRERLEYVERLYLKGVAEHAIKSRVCRRYDVTLRTARRYLARVRDRLAALPGAQPEAVRARSEAMLLETYALARRAVKYVTFQEGVGSAVKKETKPVAAPEVGTMASVAYRLAELSGAAKPQRIDVTSGGQPLTDAHAQLAAAIARLAEEPDAGGASETSREPAPGDG